MLNGVVILSTVIVRISVIENYVDRRREGINSTNRVVVHCSNYSSSINMCDVLLKKVINDDMVCV